MSLPALALVPSQPLFGRSQDVPIPDPSSAAKDSASSLARASPGIFSSASLPSKGLSPPPLCFPAAEGSWVPLLFAVGTSDFTSAGASWFSGAEFSDTFVAFASSGVRVDSEEVGEVDVPSGTFSDASIAWGLLSDCASAVLVSCRAAALSLFAFCCISWIAAIFMKRRYLRHKRMTCLHQSTNWPSGLSTN